MRKNGLFFKTISVSLSALLTAGVCAFTACGVTVDSSSGGKVETPEIEKIDDLTDERYVNL